MKRKLIDAKEYKSKKIKQFAPLPLIELILGNILQYMALSTKLIFSQTCRSVRQELLSVDKDYRDSIKTENFLNEQPKIMHFVEILQDVIRADELFKKRKVNQQVENFIQTNNIKAVSRRTSCCKYFTKNTLVYEIYKFGIDKYLYVTHSGSTHSGITVIQEAPFLTFTYKYLRNLVSFMHGNSSIGGFIKLLRYEPQHLKTFYDTTQAGMESFLKNITAVVMAMDMVVISSSPFQNRIITTSNKDDGDLLDKLTLSAKWFNFVEQENIASPLFTELIKKYIH